MSNTKRTGPALRRIALADLVMRSGSGNRLQPRVRRAIAQQIDQTGLYPPLIVRPRKQVRRRQRKYEILDGAQRADILAELGHATARCEVWPVGDRQAEITAATINHLRSRCGAEAFARRIRRLTRLLGERSTCELLALSPAAIRQRLLALDRPMPSAALPSVDLRAVTFHLPKADLASLEETLTSFSDGSQKRGELLMAAVRAASGNQTKKKE